MLGVEQCRIVYVELQNNQIICWGHGIVELQYSSMRTLIAHIYHWLITNVKFINTTKTNQGSMKHFQVPQGLRKPLRGYFVIRKSLRNIYAFIYINFG